MELDQVTFAFFVDESVCVDSEALHHAVRARNGSVRHGPHEHVSRLGVKEGKVPEVVVGGLGLGNLIVRFRLDGVDCSRLVCLGLLRCGIEHT